ncbi:MAG: hypothetical protein LBC58_01730 [Clostridiales Family XIII bacterium]|jgi:hypothetical protein|nr:hypothetical protein [Clostridiales Family XIII bacterium]
MKISKSAIFLFELMFVILVFTVSAAICANIFGQSYKYSEKATDLTQAVLIAESVAEEFKAGEITDGKWKNYFNKEWHEVGVWMPGLIDWVGGPDEKEMVHNMTVNVGLENGLRVCRINVDDGLYELTAKKSVAG